MKHVLLLCCIIVGFQFSHGLRALEREGKEFKIFQFPRTMMPCIDGDTSDWDMVPESYTIDTSELSDTVRGNGTDIDRSDLDITVKFGWVAGINRIYVLYEAYDDYWNMTPTRGDIFELAVDADMSGGPYIRNPQLEEPENHFRFKGVHAQNYHIFTPPGKGRDWAMIWGCQPWAGEFPQANWAYDYDFEEGEDGFLTLECWITPYDYAPFEGPEHAVVSQLVEDTLIAMSFSVLDYDEKDGQYEGFWNLSHKTSMDHIASDFVVFRLMPPEPEYLPELKAEFRYTVINLDAGTVAFTDESIGEIDTWVWDFGDDTVSYERNPVHTYEQSGEYTVILTVSGPSGEAKRIKVRQVAVK